MLIARERGLKCVSSAQDCGAGGFGVVLRRFVGSTCVARSHSAMMDASSPNLLWTMAFSCSTALLPLSSAVSMAAVAAT